MVCLSGGQEEGKRALAQLAARAKGAAVAAVPVEGAQEGALRTYFGPCASGRTWTSAVWPCWGPLRRQTGCGGWGAVFPSGSPGCAPSGGHGDPYEARALKDVPLRAYPVKGEPLVLRDGRARRWTWSGWPWACGPRETPRWRSAARPRGIPGKGPWRTGLWSGCCPRTGGLSSR